MKHFFSVKIISLKIKNIYSTEFSMGWSTYETWVIWEMVNFSNTINYLAIQMNNETSFKQHNKERFIIVAGVKEWEGESIPFGVADQYVGLWFVGSMCEASISVFFSDRVPSGISSSDVREVCLCCWLMALCSSTHKKKKGQEKIVLERKKELMRSAWIGQLVAKLLGGGIDLRKEIDLWLLQNSSFDKVWICTVIFF